MTAVLDRYRTRRRLVLVAYLVVLVILMVGAALGPVSLWAVLIWSVVPVAILTREVIGAAMGLVVGLVGLGAMAMLGLIVGPVFQAPSVPVLLVVAGLAGTVGTLGLLRMPRIRTPTRSNILAITGSALGSLVWLVVLIVARVRPGSAGLSWVMNGDAANNLLFARVDLHELGFQFGAAQNPVPLPPGLLAVGMAAGRSSLPSAQLLRHDIEAFASVWGVIIALICLLTGIAAAMWIDPTRPRIRALAGAGASLIPISWWVVGYPIEYGFLNAHVALVLILCCWIAYASCRLRPMILVGILAFCASLLLAVWSPLVLLPVLLGIVVIIQHRRSLMTAVRADRAVAVVGLAQLLAYGLLVTVPSVLSQGSALAASGGSFPFSRWVFIVLLAAALAMVLLSWRLLGPSVALGALAVLATAGVGYAVLLFAARGTADPAASYYPSKFAWLSGVFLFVTVLGLAIGIATRRLRRVATLAVALVVVFAVAFAGVRLATVTRTGYVALNPAQRILVTGFGTPGDQVAGRIFEYADLAAPIILVRSDDPHEAQIDFWVLQMQADSVIAHLDIRKAAYGLIDLGTPKKLCSIVRQIGVPVTVVTADRQLARDVAADCPDAGVRFRVTG